MSQADRRPQGSDRTGKLVPEIEAISRLEKVWAKCDLGCRQGLNVAATTRAKKEPKSLTRLLTP